MAKHHVVLHMVLLLYSTTLAKKLTPVENEVLGPTLAGPKNPLELTFERNASLVGMALSYMLCGYGTEITMEVTHYDNGEQVGNARIEETTSVGCLEFGHIERRADACAFTEAAEAGSGTYKEEFPKSDSLTFSLKPDEQVMVYIFIAYLHKIDGQLMLPQLPGPHLSRPKDLVHHQEGADNPETYTWSENPPECVAGQCEQEWYFVPVSAEASTTYYKPSLCYLMVVSSLNTNAPLTDTESQVIANEPGTYEVHLAVVPANASMFTKLVRGVVMFSETHTFVTVPKPRPKSRFLHSVLVSVAALGCLVGMVWVVWSLWFTDSDSASAWQAQAEDEPAYSNIPGDYAGGPSSTAPGGSSVGGYLQRLRGYQEVGGTTQLDEEDGL
jgi:hypothetical protein|uniref:Uncharacterized protein n=1 Tax=Eutreptiella gymnastica TaxID=73025 RepID=A0A6T2K1E6_9EUGL|mmetsp:Transcript_1934/g.3621  ORF Transcript_1934/g.3621 Transcript_1934/m.3621 type:complete len:385 (-) Transcript_1934:817-1971(-)|eukprot:CAMPEP_0174293796 /NCGR_PEP_ID=MMETSP0809-20121228/39738_1 /TAXON_ID=73025 ORGANISM="Eutreptiella gymnastica-like, Strain CCMP1594" /NCGR_SAMPLE_ID=MMETSP0809 /ASSEMBLY_ACC=CAM_ASM_000658 /LENGTH=384 /DNA_ID=CAMNT_0015394841 /DNA_START=23 /DNA_END=1177 /DNA_ORIENTATION=+